MRLNLLLSFVILLGAPFGWLMPGAAPSAAAFQISLPQAQGATVSYRPGAVLVSFKPGAAKSGRAALAQEGLEVTQEIPELRVVSVGVPVGQEEAMAQSLSRQSDVAYAELDYLASAQAIPNDPIYDRQWGLAKTGAPQAWDITTGTGGPIVAVVDSGVDLNHPDLTAKIWHNAGEIPHNGKDDDGNGYVDDADGWHFYHDPISGEPRQDRFVDDDYGHGTHVFGIAGAATNNGIGVAGVSWGSPVMAVKVLDSKGEGFYSEIASGILYAAANGARVINLSLGGSASSQTLCGAVSAATSLGKLVVAAAGNGGGAVEYPAMCPGVLAVAATDRSDKRASFSNTGSRIDLAAPGVDIWSTYYLTGLKQHTYTNLDGTSEAAPFVSGAAALIWTRWPALTADGVKAQLLATVADVGTPGRDDETGWGRLDVGAAVAAPAAAVDLRVHAAVSPSTVVAGNPLTASFVVTNAGASSASSVTLHATLPADPTSGAIQSGSASCRLAGAEVTCGVSRLDPGASVTVSVVVTPTQVRTGQLTTTASVSSAQRELTPTDNEQSVKSAIQPVLSGRVFLDSNGDGVLETWETGGLANAYLFLEQNDQPIAFAASAAPDGAFHLDTLALGNYVLRAEVPQGYVLTTPAEIVVAVEPGEASVVYFGAWTGTAEPTPTPTPTTTPTATPVPGASRPLFLPLIVR